MGISPNTTNCDAAYHTNKNIMPIRFIFACSAAASYVQIHSIDVKMLVGVQCSVLWETVIEAKCCFIDVS